MLKTIFFDLGNVLVFFSHPKMFRQIADCCGLTEGEVRNILYDEGVHAAYESGIIDSDALFHLFQTRSRQFFTPLELMQAASDIFTPNTDLCPIIEHLKKSGLRLVLLSNTSECHFNRVFAHYPILRLFDDFVLSFEVGAMKPDKKIFLKALEKAQCHPKHCFYTDDIPEFIAEAKKVGLDGEIFMGIPSLKEALAQRGIIRVSS